MLATPPEAARRQFTGAVFDAVNGSKVTLANYQVPEPATGGLLALGAAALLSRRRGC